MKKFITLLLFMLVCFAFVFCSENQPCKKIKDKIDHSQKKAVVDFSDHEGDETFVAYHLFSDNKVSLEKKEELSTYQAFSEARFRKQNSGYFIKTKDKVVCLNKDYISWLRLLKFVRTDL